jgi:hypothetical protein
VIFGCLLLARSLDFLTTYMVTPDLKREWNPVIRWLGWRWSILANIIACWIFSAARVPSLLIIIGSVLVAAWNYCVYKLDE